MSRSKIRLNPADAEFFKELADAGSEVHRSLIDFYVRLTGIPFDPADKATNWVFMDGSPAVMNMPLAIADPPEPEPGLYACSGCGWRFERRTAMGSVWRGAMWGDKFGGQHGGPYSWDELTEAYGDCVGRLVLVDESKTAQALAKLLEEVINHIPEQQHRKVSRWREQLARLRP